VGKLQYFLQSAGRWLTRTRMQCPSCGSSKRKVVDRKYVVTTLNRCLDCRLLFRAPTTPEVESIESYQSEYAQGFTTDCPKPEELQKLKEKNFRGCNGDFSNIIRILRGLKVPDGAKVYDFGCSWGYGTCQLARAGFAVDSFEISKPRASYAAQFLDAKLVTPEAAQPGSYDVFLSSHVIEHVPSVAAMIDTAMRLLKPGGLMVTFTPNGSDELRRREPVGWHMMWGNVHPQLVDEDYLLKRFTSENLLIGPSTLDEEQLSKFGTERAIVHPNHNFELFAVVQKPRSNEPIPVPSH